MKIVEERDSLRTVNEKQSARIDNFEQTVSIMNSSLDSIAREEQMIFINTTGDSESPVTKDIVRQNLSRFELIINRQKERIERLEQRLKEASDSASQSLELIAHLKMQIRAKDVQISQLKQELEKKNVDIASLQEQVESQRLTINTQATTINELSLRTKKQNEALAKQDAILNNGYVLIGTKDDLKRKGIVKKGHIVSDAVLDRSKFAKVDIRNWEEVSFSAKRPRILTDMPTSSYEITTSGDRNFTLHILSPSDFWRISSYLVIQTD